MPKPLRVVVNCTTSFETKYVMMREGSKGQAIITTGWSEAVDAFKLREGDICNFTFLDERTSRYKDPTCWLRLVIHILKP
jgi:hypothetical protein